MIASALDQARQAFQQRAWSAARSAYAPLPDAALSLDDLERYATAAHLVGDETGSRDVLARGYKEALKRDDTTHAVRFAFFLGQSMMFTGEMGQAGGWFGGLVPCLRSGVQTASSGAT